jgi:hemerythrin-like domain-containing protein
MRHASLIPLSHDHHHGLALALRCRKQALGRIRPVGIQGLRERVKEVEKFFSENLKPHFRAEEEVLFPLMRSLVPESRPLIEELLTEHALLRERVAELDKTEALGRRLFDFGDIIERHIRREERELFPLFEKHVSGTEAEKVEKEIEKILGSRKPKSKELR